MLETVDFNQPKMSKEEYKKAYDPLVERLVLLQQHARSQGVGMVVLFEGWNGAGKGSRISDLMYNLDARATTVHVTHDVSEKKLNEFPGRESGVTNMHPLMEEFWKALGPQGNITFFDRGWYAKALAYSDCGIKDSTLEHAIKSFEEQLTASGYTLVKFFLHASPEGLKSRLKKLRKDPLTSWRVSKEDLASLDRYEKDYRTYDALLEHSNFNCAPWTVLNGHDKRHANLRIVQVLADALEARLEKPPSEEEQEAAKKAQANSAGTAQQEAEATPEEKRAQAQLAADVAHSHAPLQSKYVTDTSYPSLATVDYTLALPKDEYRILLKQEQKRLFRLEMEIFQKRIPVMIAFEGQDAAGKGGAIKRVAQALDARSYTIFPSPAPTKIELAHPFLWRYWTRLPKAGHVGIYDRSWYGRVLVERVEGFASTAEWRRAYDEINEFERDLVNWGAVLLKFWVEISPEEQLTRFHARQENPNKQWKITPEDWRNREKAPQYHSAIEDMLRLTSTPYAPWHILESENKYYARIKALKTINDALEKRLRE